MQQPHVEVARDHIPYTAAYGLAPTRQTLYSRGNTFHTMVRQARGSTRPSTVIPFWPSSVEPDCYTLCMSDQLPYMPLKIHLAEWHVAPIYNWHRPQMPYKNGVCLAIQRYGIPYSAHKFNRVQRSINHQRCTKRPLQALTRRMGRQSRGKAPEAKGSTSAAGTICQAWYRRANQLLFPPHVLFASTHTLRHAEPRQGALSHCCVLCPESKEKRINDATLRTLPLHYT